MATTTGLSPATVSAIRHATGSRTRSDTRLGRDGRLRPLNATVGRQMAAELLTVRPDASLRQVADVAGISPGTVRDVRARMSRGEGPQPTPPSKKRPAALTSRAPGQPPRHVRPADITMLLAKLSRDPPCA